MTEKKKSGFFARLLQTDLPEEFRERQRALEQAAPREPDVSSEMPETEADPVAPPAAPTLPEIVPPVVPPPAPPTPPPAPVSSGGGGTWFQRLRQGLSRSSNALTTGIGDLLTKRRLDDQSLDELEDLLLQADLGLETATRVVEAVSKGRYNAQVTPDEVKAILAGEVARVLQPVARPLVLTEAKPHVVLVIGVNGSGKTTTIGKLAAKFRADGRSVMLAAGDTFRAAATEQLKIWAERTGASILARETGADAAGLGYDALIQARAEGADVLMMDTAGRLQNRAELMGELEKIVRVMRKVDPAAPHSVLLVLDATVGQNALLQVEIFGRTAGVTGLAMTKLDGTARGGILVAIAEKHGLPVHFIGIGEGVDDLEPFDANDFARAMVGLGDDR